MPDVVINDQNYTDFIEPIIDGERKSHGLKPRNYHAHPPGYLACAPVFDPGLIIPENEWASRLKDQQNAKASLFDLRESNYELLKSLDQDSYGYCWSFSTTKSTMYARASANDAPVRLSAWMVAAIIKNYRDEGGWGAESLEFIAKNGVASLEEWPQGQVKRALDTPMMRTAAMKRRITEWWDGTENREQNRRIMISAFLMGLAPVLDFNWWSHSVCGCRIKNLNPLVIDIDNSWGESAGDRGIYTLEGNKAIPDGIVIPRVSSPSP